MTIGDGVKVGAQSGVIASIPAGQTYFGYPAMAQREAFKQQVILRKLPDMYKQFQQFQKEAQSFKNLSFWGRVKKLLGR
jgi:UDP-3-O-[3-hydroxymyristoyl] glucosamine N-acyltransferase